MLFEIPDSWAWCHLENFVLAAFSGKSPKYSKEPTPHKIVGQQANQWDGLDLRFVKYATEEFAENMPPYYYLQDGDVLLNTLGNGTLGRSSYYRKTNSSEFLLTDGHLFVFRTLDKAMSYYLKIYLKDKYDEIVKSANGSTNQTFLSLGKTLQWFVPVPPLSEQARIVTEIEKFEPLIAEYDKLEQQATKLDDEIYDKLKKSILQYAIQGKLVPQDPNDEPASVLLERIRAEKKAKLGKKFVDSYIYKGDDNCYYEHIAARAQDEPVEVLFDIPENWAFTRLDTIIGLSSGTNLTSATMAKSEQIYPVFGGNGITGYYDKYNIGVDHIIIGRVGFYCGSIHVTNKKSWITDNALIVSFDNSSISTSFFALLLESLELGKKSSATAQPLVTGKIIKPIIVALPPLAEQKRIVAKINEIFAML